MAKYTDNFNLKKPDQDDFYNVEDQNENMDKIDAELKTLADSMDGSAVADAVAAIDTKIGTNTDAVGTTTVFARLKQIYDHLASVLSSARAAKIDNLNATITSRQADVGLTSTHVGRLDAAISSRQASVLTSTHASRIDAAISTRASQVSLEALAIKRVVASNNIKETINTTARTFGFGSSRGGCYIGQFANKNLCGTIRVRAEIMTNFPGTGIYPVLHVVSPFKHQFTYKKSGTPLAIFTEIRNDIDEIMNSGERQDSSKEFSAAYVYHDFELNVDRVESPELFITYSKESGNYGFTIRNVTICYDEVL